MSITVNLADRIPVADIVPDDFDVLTENLTDNLTNVKTEFDRKMALAKKYGFDEYADELVRLIEKIDYYRKA